MSALICTVISLIMAGPALAHGDDAHTNASSWTFDPWIVLPIAVISLLYVSGRIRLSRRAHRSGQMRWQDLFFSCGMLTLAGTLISPLHWLGEHLFTFHIDRARDRHGNFGATHCACAPGGPSLVGTAEASAPGDWHPYGVSLPFAGHGNGVPAGRRDGHSRRGHLGMAPALSFSTPRLQAPPCIAFNT
jgi:hypothetical protein